MPKLVVIAKGKPREIEMGQELTIGRGYSNLLRLEGDEVSRVHAIIYRRNDDFILRDLDSKNGVFLNGSKINHAPLGPGDKVQVGKYKMVFNPPSNFDIQAFADSAMRSDSTTNGKRASSLLREDMDFETSRRFKVSMGGTPSCDLQVEADSCEPREEVYMFGRAEFLMKLREQTGRIAEMAADHQDAFFLALAKAERKSVDYSESVLKALVDAISADRGVIILRNHDGELEPGAIVAEQQDVAVNRVVLKSAFQEEKALLCPRTDESGLLRDNDTVKRDRIATLLAVPLGSADVRAVLYLDRTGESDSFNLGHLLVAGRVGRLLELYYAVKND